MTEREFIYWLQGFLEISNPNSITTEQLTIIKNHLKLVMTKVTPETIPYNPNIITRPDNPFYPTIFCTSGSNLTEKN